MAGPAIAPTIQEVAMPELANTCVVGLPAMNFELTVDGPIITQHINHLAREIEKVYGVADAKPLPTHHGILVTYRLLGDETDAFAVRLRVRNRVLDFIGEVTGNEPNLDNDSDRADLAEALTSISV